MPAIIELKRAYKKQNDPKFQQKIAYYLKDYVGEKHP